MGLDETVRDWRVVSLTAGQDDAEKAPFSICKCINLRVAPASRAAHSLLLLPLFRLRPSDPLSTWVESIICVSADLTFGVGVPEQVFPDTALSPAHETVLWRRPVFGRAIAPATATLEDMIFR